MSNFRLAVSFLTVLPLYGKRTAREKDMARSLYYYFLVGFLIGGILFAAAHLTTRLKLGMAGDVLLVVLWVILTGGLHLDGLMDSADGIFSGRDRNQKLEIMKDSRVGAMGAIALLVIFMTKVSFLNIIAYPMKNWTLLCAPALGRAVMVYPIVFFPYARKEAGLGRAFGSRPGKLAFPLGLIITMTAGFFLAGAPMLLGMTAAVFSAAALAAGISKILGGHTGDTYGALCEICEALFIVSIAIVQGL